MVAKEKLKKNESRLEMFLDSEDQKDEQRIASKQKVKIEVVEQDHDAVSLRARSDLLEIARSAPNLQKALGFLKHQKVTDMQILEALRKDDYPVTKLKDAGLDVTSAARCANLLPLALEAAPRKTSLKDRVPMRWRISAVILFVGGILFLGGWALLIFEKKGWTAGKCNLANFWNSTLEQPCTGKCIFDVSVRSERKVLVANKWEPQRLRDKNGDIVFVGEQFRCCDMEHRLQCCSFWEEKTLLFCDSWPHRQDTDGKTCPSGQWDCLFKLDPNDDSIVTEMIIDFEQTAMKGLFVSSALFLCFAVFAFFGDKIWRLLRHCFANAQTRYLRMNRNVSSDVWQISDSKVEDTAPDDVSDAEDKPVTKRKQKKKDVDSHPAEVIAFEGTEGPEGASHPRSSSLHDLEAAAMETSVEPFGVNDVMPFAADMDTHHADTKLRNASKGSERKASAMSSELRLKDTPGAAKLSLQTDIEMHVDKPIDHQKQADEYEAFDPERDEYLRQLALKSEAAWFRPIVTPFTPAKHSAPARASTSKRERRIRSAWSRQVRQQTATINREVRTADPDFTGRSSPKSTTGLRLSTGDPLGRSANLGRRVEDNPLQWGWGDRVGTQSSQRPHRSTSPPSRHRKVSAADDSHAAHWTDSPPGAMGPWPPGAHAIANPSHKESRGRSSRHHS